jgi:hypothetical protein
VDAPYKVLVLADSAPGPHRADLRRQGLNPAWVYQCMLVLRPAHDGPPDAMARAAAFAHEFPVGTTGRVAMTPDGRTADGRWPIVGAFQGLVGGRLRVVRFLVGLRG